MVKPINLHARNIVEGVAIITGIIAHITLMNARCVTIGNSKRRAPKYESAVIGPLNLNKFSIMVFFKKIVLI